MPTRPQQPHNEQDRLSSIESEMSGVHQEMGVFWAEIRDIKTGIAGLGSQLTTVQASLTVQSATRGTFDLKSLMSIGGFVIVMGTVIFAALDTRFQASMSGYNQRLTVVEKGVDNFSGLGADVSVSKMHDAQSMKDREALNRFVERQLETNSKVAAEMTSLHNQFIESETQQRANSQIRNVMFSGLEARVAELFDDVNKKAFPRNTYWPDISLPKPTR